MGTSVNFEGTDRVQEETRPKLYMDVYTVPDTVLFRNFDVLSQGGTQTRNLLLQNKTREPQHALVSYPFSDHFRLLTGQGQTLHPTPPHASLTVQPGVPAKLTLELKVPENSSLNYVQGEGGQWDKCAFVEIHVHECMEESADT